VIRIGWQNTCYPPGDGGKTSAPVWSLENKPCRSSSRYCVCASDAERGKRAGPELAES
jgi:hypothetical protein